jgi:hypothetical protein
MIAVDWAMCEKTTPQLPVSTHIRFCSDVTSAGISPLSWLFDITSSLSAETEVEQRILIQRPNRTLMWLHASHAYCSDVSSASSAGRLPLS